MAYSAERPILFFDGMCNLCNGAVQFIVKHDRQQRFLFASLQSPPGKQAILKTGLHFSDTSGSLILFYKGRYYTRSAAALHTARLLGGVWQLLYAGIILPRALRDAVYKFVASRRYRWFGRRSECMIPSPALKARFVE